MAKIKVCVAGITGWTGSKVAAAILKSEKFELVAGVARKEAGQDIGSALGLAPSGIKISASVETALRTSFDVLIDYTHPTSVKANTLAALEKKVAVVVGTSGLTADDFGEIERKAAQQGVGVIASGNFSITATLVKHFSLIAARYIPQWEIIDYASHTKLDMPSGTTRELAEALNQVRRNEAPTENLIGPKEARGAQIGGTPVHSLRLPGYVIAFETQFGLPGERLTLRHDAGDSAEPYVGGTLLAAERAVGMRGLIRGLDRLLFS